MFALIKHIHILQNSMPKMGLMGKTTGVGHLKTI